MTARIGGQDSAGAPHVTLYSAPDCCLCDEARDGLEALRSEGLAFELRDVDISTDEALHGAYLERIPVIELDGEVVSELGLDSVALRSRLDRVRA